MRIEGRHQLQFEQVAGVQRIDPFFFCRVEVQSAKAS